MIQNVHTQKNNSCLIFLKSLCQHNDKINAKAIKILYGKYCKYVLLQNYMQNFCAYLGCYRIKYLDLVSK